MTTKEKPQVWTEIVDNTNTYEKQIAHLAEQLKAICEVARIPFIFAAAPLWRIEHHHGDNEECSAECQVVTSCFIPGEAPPAVRNVFKLVSTLMQNPGSLMVVDMSKAEEEKRGEVV